VRVAAHVDSRGAVRTALAALIKAGGLDALRETEWEPRPIEQG
jgi:hypothetical protein